MKKPLLILIFGLLVQSAIAQTYSNDFENYSVGDYICVEAAEWDTWSGTTGGAEDVPVVEDNAHSGANSLYLSSTSGTGGPQDIVLTFNGEHNYGWFNYKKWIYVESGKGVYFNFQAEDVIGEVWAMNCFMEENGVLRLSGPSDNFKMETTFVHDTWFELEIDVNLNTNDWELFIDGDSRGVFQNDVFQVASLNLFPLNQSNNQSGFWVDDVEYTITPYTLPTLNAGLTLLEPNMELAGMNAKPFVQVRNLGTETLSSFDVSVTYNGNTITENITGVSLDSLETYDVQFTSILEVVAGEMDVVATVSNPNGGADLDSLDNTKTITVNPVIPADGKMVLVEEATGTWCQWCPRGAVVMAEMQEKYDAFFAGVAVHNDDPMMDTVYDGAMTVGGYPGGYVDRGDDIDPLEFELDFLDRITHEPETSLEIGAMYNDTTGELFVSVTTTFLSAVGDNFRVGCILVEDGVTGTGSGYNQINAYAGGGSGPMGGYEDLPFTVPASQMVYDHVARGIAPSYSGLSGAYDTPAQINDSFTINTLFTIDPEWDMDHMHIVAFAKDLGQRTDNAGLATIDEAEANGYVAGVGVGVQYLEGPDATFRLYPNPASDMVTAAVNLNEQSDVVLEMYNATGQLVSSNTFGNLNGANNLFINTTEFPAGIYSISFITNNTRVTKNLIVK